MTKKMCFMLLLAASALVSCDKGKETKKEEAPATTTATENKTEATNNAATTPTATTATTTTAATATASTPAAATNLRYAANEELNVLAPLGVVLRETPDPKGTKITNVAYGTKVKVLADDLGKNAYSVEEMPALKIEGHWVKVETGGKTGYLFDGFLSKWAAPKKGEELNTYLGRISKKGKTDKTPPKPKNSMDAAVSKYEKVSYDNGAVYIDQIYEGGASTSLEISSDKMTLVEAYLLGKTMDNDSKSKCKYVAKQKRIICEASEGGMDVFEENGKVTMRMSIVD